jgi:type II secretory pathway pseudopilin PulG
MTRPAVASPLRSFDRVAGGMSGFTLVELLVVASIMAALFGLILVGARPSVGGELRRAAQQFASVLLATQSQAIGKTMGAAVVLTSEGVRCISVVAGQKPPFVVGTVNSGMPPANPGTSTAAVTIAITNGGDLQTGYRIQFFGGDPTLPASAWFGFQPPGTVLLRAEEGQAAANTVWPAAAGSQLRARIACYPDSGNELMAFPKTIAIDLRYSGTGDDPSTPWGGLGNKQNIGLSFDSVGTVDALMRGLGGTAAGRQLDAPVYFLVATRADIEADEALTKDRSMWVVVQPQTGRVTVSANIAQAGKDRTALRAARASARAGLAAGK